MPKISTKTIARIAAVQALYEYSINNNTQNIDELFVNTLNNYSLKDFHSLFDVPDNVIVKLHKNYLKELLNQTINNIDKIDNIIANFLAAGWKFSAMHLSLVAILRVAVAELIYFPEVPFKVVIDEFTTLASEIVKQHEVAFVNSLLDNIRMKYRQ